MLPYDGPNVIAIINETFSDLSSYPGLEDANAAPPFFREVAADALASGDVYVSAMGGGTCNSEFEFLTGASMGNMGGGVYPYVLYDLEGVDNLAAAFRALGYGTHAIHPAEASNWRRGRGGQPGRCLPGTGLRHPRHSSGRGVELAPRPHLRAARLR